MWTGTDPDELMATWATELAPYAGGDIRYALDAMRSSFPDWPPTLFQFADLCRDSKRRRSQSTALLTQERQPMPERVREQLRGFKAKYPGCDALMRGGS